MTDETYIGLAVLSVLALTGLAIFGVIEESNQWREFSKNHECKEIGSITGSSSIGVGVGSNGGVSVVPVYTPGKTGYQCNDGKQYWR